MRNLTNDETEYTFGRNLSNDNGEILSFDLSANLPLVYTSNTDEASVIGLKGLNALGSANQVLAMDGTGTNMIFKNDSTIDLDTAVSYSSQAASDISFGNPTTLRKITMHTGEFLITSGSGVNNDCILKIQADKPENNDYANPEIQLLADGDTTQARIFLDDNDLKILHSQDYAIQLGANGSTQLIIDENDVKCYRSHLSVSAYANGEKPRIFFAPYQNATDFGKYLKLEVDINDVSPIDQRTLIMPNVNDTIVCKATTDTLTNKTIYNPIFDGDAGTTNSRLQIQDSNKTHKINILAPDIGSDINVTLPSSTGVIALEGAIPTDSANSTAFGTTAGANIEVGNASYITKIMGNINVDGTLFTMLKCGNQLQVSNGNSSQGAIFFKEDSDNGSHYVMLQGEASLASNFTLTMPSITDTLITKTSTDTLTNKSGNISQWTNDSGYITSATSDITTATSVSTSAGSAITIGTTNKKLTLQGNELDIKDSDGTTILNITDSDALFTGADIAIQARSSSIPPRIIFWDSDKSHYIGLVGQEITSNTTLTLPHVTAELAYKGQNISEFTNNSGYITASSTENLSNKTFTDLTNFNASLSVKDSSNFGTGSVRFYDDDNSHYTEIYAPTTLLANHGLQLPNTTGTLALFTQIPTNTNQLTNGAGFITASSTETLTNKTLDNAIFTGTSGDNPRLTIKDNNLDHNAIIKCINFTADRTFYLNDDGGTILTSNTTSPNVSKVQNYSNDLPNGTAINFGSGGTSTSVTDINNVTFGCANLFTFGSGKGSNGDCVLKILSDSDNAVEASNPELQFSSDGGGTIAKMYLDDNDFYITHQDTASFLKIGVGTSNTYQLSCDPNDVRIYKSDLKISATASAERPKIEFYANDQADTENYKIIMEADIKDGVNEGTNTLLLPAQTATLSYNGQNISLFNNDSGYLTSSSITSAINVSTDTISGNPQRNFGNTLSQYVINASNFFVYATGQNFFDSANSNCEMVIKAGDTASDSYMTRLNFYTKGNTKRAEIFKNTGDEFVIKNIDERLELGGEDEIQLKLDANDVKVFRSDFSISSFSTSYYARILFATFNSATSFTNRIILNAYQHDTLNTGAFEVFLLPFNSDLCQSRSGASSTRYLNFWTSSNTATLLRQDIYGCMCEGNNGSGGGDRGYPFAFRTPGVSSSYYAYWFNQSDTNGKHWGAHTNGVADNFMVEQNQDIRFTNTDLIGYTNTGHGYSKLCLGDIYCSDIFADDVKSDGVLLTSDRRLKKDIKPIENALSTINKLECKTFLKKVNPQDDIWSKEWRLDSGFIAQDLWNDVPELQHIVNGVETDISSNFDASGRLIDDCIGYKIIQTSTDTCVPCDLDASGNINTDAGKHLTDATYEKVLDPDKRLSLNYEEIIPYCCKAIQELDSIVKQQQEQISQQQVIIDKLISSNSFKEFKS